MSANERLTVAERETLRFINFYKVLERPIEQRVRFPLIDKFHQITRGSAHNTRGVMDHDIRSGVPLYRNRTTSALFVDERRMVFAPLDHQTVLFTTAVHSCSAFGVRLEDKTEPSSTPIFGLAHIFGSYPITRIAQVLRRLKSEYTIKEIICDIGDSYEYFEELAEGLPDVLVEGRYTQRWHARGMIVSDKGVVQIAQRKTPSRYAYRTHAVRRWDSLHK